MTVLFDIETRSRTDLRKKGSRPYAADSTTEILSASWYDYETGQQGLWLPGIDQKLLEGNTPIAGMLRTHVPTSEVSVYGGSDIPAPLLALAQSGRPFVAHNAWGFDQIVWEAKTPKEAHPASWIDTDPLARAVGLPGGLDKIGVALRGSGKHQAGKSRLKKFFKYKNVPKPADLILIGAYCWDDTCGLLKVLWDYLQSRKLHPFEQKVLASHRVVNGTGVRIDFGLANAIKTLAGHAADQAFEQCVTITGGKGVSPFKEKEDLRKKDTVIDWILRQSARMSAILPQTDKSTPEKVSYSLKKDVVEQLLRDMETQEQERDSRDGSGAAGITDDMEDEGEEVALEQVVIPPQVVDFLKTRFAVLRVTEGKIDAAVDAMHDGRLYDLLVYFGAHTGRFAGRRMQVHNLPRPKETVPVWDWDVKGQKGIGLTTLYAWSVDPNTGRGHLDPAAVQEILDAYYNALVASGRDPATLDRATLDDAASALLRGVLLPDEGDVFVAGDYNAIELRGGAWLADEEVLLAALRARGDVYCQMAERIFGRPCNGKKDPIRQVGKVVVLGCLYQLGEKKLGTYAASMGVDLAAAGTTPRECVQAFRDLYPEIAGHRSGDFTEDNQPIRRDGIWARLQAAALKAADRENGNLPVRVGRITFVRKGADLHLILPSGRPIIYRNAEVEWVVPSWEKDKDQPRKREAVVYSSPRGFRSTLYGGKLLENAVQALCRDLLVEAMVLAMNAGYKVRFTVHDELIASVVGAAQGRDVMRIMSTPPDWADGFPILVEADMMSRYSKQRTPGMDSFNFENGKELAA